VAHHLLVNYQRAHIAIIKAQFTSKRLRDGMEVRAVRPDVLFHVCQTPALALICLCCSCSCANGHCNTPHSRSTCLRYLLQGVLAVAEACGMQNLLKAAGVEYQVQGWRVAVVVSGTSASCATQATQC
jgi:hypothetical protein